MPFINITGVGSVLLAPNNDDGMAPFAIPFPISFYNVTYPAGFPMYVSSNGYITFNQTTVVYDGMLTNDNLTILVAGRDFVVASEGLLYKSSGISPNRIVVISWHSFLYGDPPTARTQRFQIQFNESTGIIAFVYLNRIAPSTVIGIKNPQNTTFTKIFANGQTSYPYAPFSLCYKQGGVAQNPPPPPPPPYVPVAVALPPAIQGPNAQGYVMVDSRAYCPIDFEDISATGTLLWNDTLTVGSGASFILPFRISIYGSTYLATTVMSMCALGYIALDNAQCTDVTYGLGQVPIQRLTAFHYLQDAFSNGRGWWATRGTAPNRRLIFQWQMHPRYRSSIEQSLYQMKVFEGKKF